MAIDLITAQKHADGLPAKIKVTRLIGAGHIPHIEKSADVNTLIMSLA